MRTQLRMQLHIQVIFNKINFSKMFDKTRHDVTQEKSYILRYAENLYIYMYIIVVEDPRKHLRKPHGATFKFIQISCYHLLHASRDRGTIVFVI